MKYFICTLYTIAFFPFFLHAQQHFSVHKQQKEYYESFKCKSIQDYDQLNNFRLMPKTPKSTSCTLEKIVFGWHPSWVGSAYLNYQWDCLSDLSYFSYEVNPNTGNAYTTNGWETSAAIDSAQANGTRVNLCVTLFSDHTTFFANPSAQQTLITNLISLVQLRNADGVNIDFEGVPSSQSANLTAFMIDLCNQMHTVIPSSQVSICLYAVDWSNLFDVATLDNYVDYFTIMGYGYYYSGSSVAGPTAQLYTMSTFNYNLTKTITTYIAAGASKEKLVLGLPYYGQEWNTTVDTVPSATTSFVSARTYSFIRNNASGNYSNKKWESNSRNPYHVYYSSNWRQCFFDDEVSLGYKYDMVNQRDIAGIGIWALGYDNGYTELWNLIEEKFTTCAYVPCSDTIYDMGGPAHDYYNDEYYSFTIAPSNAVSLSLDFLSFSLEAGYDSLWIYDGADTSAALIGGYSGTNSPGYISSSSNALTLEFYSDGWTTAPGWQAIWQCFIDTTPPTTAITAANWATDDFTAYFNDQDNAAIDTAFYQVLDYHNGEWLGNAENGFFNDNFNASIHSEWYNISGSWSISAQHLLQSDEISSNTNMYFELPQDSSGIYLYHWQMNIGGSGSNRRAGLHFFCDSAQQSNRHNCYMVYYRVDQNTCQIYRYDDNVFSLKTSDNCIVNENAWYDCKVIFNANTGEIKAFLNDTLVSTWTDENPYTFASHVSLRTGNSYTMFDDVKVYKTRTDTAIVFVDDINGDVRYQNINPSTAACRIKSLVIDKANNFSTAAALDVNIDWTVPDSLIAVFDGLANDLDTTNTSSSLSANWTTAIDTNSGISHYAFAIGTKPGDTNIVVWTNNAYNVQCTANALSLQHDTMYYVSVFAVNQAGLYSDTIISDGIIYIDPLITKINANSQKKVVLLYPNPVKDRLYFSETSTYYLFDANGKYLDSGTASYIEMQDLSSGIYFVRIENNITTVIKE